MTITRRTVLTGIGAAAVAPAMPGVAAPCNLTATQVIELEIDRMVAYGRGPLTECLPRLRAINVMVCSASQQADLTRATTPTEHLADKLREAFREEAQNTSMVQRST